MFISLPVVLYRGSQFAFSVLFCSISFGVRYSVRFFCSVQFACRSLPTCLLPCPSVRLTAANCSVHAVQLACQCQNRPEKTTHTLIRECVFVLPPVLAGIPLCVCVRSAASWSIHCAYLPASFLFLSSLVSQSLRLQHMTTAGQ